jgi:glucosyl-3-phosphoglycerate synthase
MGDFAQNSPIPTLHNFNTKSLEDMEADLKLFSGYRPMELILPSLFSGAFWRSPAQNCAGN